MILPPSNGILDSNFIAQLLPGTAAASGDALNSAPALPEGQGATPFEALLPDATLDATLPAASGSPVCVGGNVSLRFGAGDGAAALPTAGVFSRFVDRATPSSDEPATAETKTEGEPAKKPGVWSDGPKRRTVIERAPGSKSATPDDPALCAVALPLAVSANTPVPTTINLPAQPSEAKSEEDSADETLGEIGAEKREKRPTASAGGDADVDDFGSSETGASSSENWRSDVSVRKATASENSAWRRFSTHALGEATNADSRQAKVAPTEEDATDREAFSRAFETAVPAAKGTDFTPDRKALVPRERSLASAEDAPVVARTSLFANAAKDAFPRRDPEGTARSQLPVSESSLSADSAVNLTSPSLLEAAVQPNVAEPSLLPRFRSPKGGFEKREANIADSAEEIQRPLRGAIRGAEKNFLNSDSQQLTKRDAALGTDVAKPAALMPTHVPTTFSAHPAFEYAGTGVAPAHESAGVASDAQPVPVQEVPTAHHAVEAVLRAVDHTASREQHSVNLHFSVGESDLHVRVELRADEVHTTFSTDSSDLRNALSHEWQSVVNNNESPAYRIAPATFTSEHSASNSFGDASSRDRQQQQAARDPQSFFGSGAFSVSRAASAETRTELRAAATLAPASSRHLSTLA